MVGRIRKIGAGYPRVAIPGSRPGEPFPALSHHACNTWTQHAQMFLIASIRYYVNLTTTAHYYASRRSSSRILQAGCPWCTEIIQAWHSRADLSVAFSLSGVTSRSTFRTRALTRTSPASILATTHSIPRIKFFTPTKAKPWRVGPSRFAYDRW